MAVLWVCLGLLAATVVPAMVRDWYLDENYSHGFLIPLVSAYVLWTRRDSLRRASGRCDGDPLGLAVCLAGLGLYVLGRAGAEFFLQRSSLIFVTAGAVLWVWGRPTLRVAAGPLAFLLFMVPLPYLVYDSVAFPLKLLAARVATETLFHLGVPVFREGNIIHLANQTLEVADACSGIRSLVSLVALGVVFAYFTESSRWKRIVLVLSTIPIAIVANAFRVAGTGFLAHYVSPRAAEGFFHTFSGWLVFVVAFVLLMALGGLLKLLGASNVRRGNGEGR